MKAMWVLFGAGALLAALQVNPLLGVEISKRTYDLVSGQKSDQLNRIELTLEVGGELKVNRDTEDKPKPMKMNVSGKLAYDERLLAPAAKSPGSARSVRYYHNADAVLKLGSTTLKPSLRLERRLMSAQYDGSALTLFSPSGSLTREELDLIEVFGSSLMIERLLPGKSLTVGDRWKHSPEDCAALLGLDHVSETSLESTLVGIVEGLARVETTGKVKGTFGGAETQIEVKGKFQFSLAGKQITWVGLLIKENRQPGEVSAGVDVVALLQMNVSPISASPQLTDTALHGIPLAPNNERTQLIHRAADGVWTITYDRKWYMNTDRREMTLLRFVEDGQRIGECHIKTMAKTDPGSRPKLAQFEEEVRQALGKNFEKLVESREITHAAHYRAFRVVVNGEATGSAVQWTYYLLTDEQGHQVVLAFTTLQENVDRFAGVDSRLISAFRFTGAQMSAKMTESTKK